MFQLLVPNLGGKGMSGVTARKIEENMVLFAAIFLAFAFLYLPPCIFHSPFKHLLYTLRLVVPGLL